MATVEEDQQPTFPCRICGRNFIKSSLEKHEPSCKKLTKMQRKVFDSGKQRAAGSDIPLRDVRKAAKEREKIGGIFPRPQTHWRERHEEFIGAVSASKEVGRALKTGQPLPPPRTAGSSDQVRCEFCGRTFSQNAAERHIAFCREQHARKKTPAPTVAKAKKATTTTTTSQVRQKTPGQTRQKTPGSATSSTTSASRNGVSAVPPGTAKTPSSTASSGSRRSSRPSSASAARRRLSSFSNGTVGGGDDGGGTQMTIGGAAVGGSGSTKAPMTPSKLPQPTKTKRSNSAPRAQPPPTIGQKAAVGGKSSFATPKSASSTGKGGGGGGGGSVKGKKK